MNKLSYLFTCIAISAVATYASANDIDKSEQFENDYSECYEAAYSKTEQDDASVTEHYRKCMLERGYTEKDIQEPGDETEEVDVEVEIDTDADSQE